jgi:hypothetical protein
MPTPVGPLGPDEFDPNDPDLWDWETSARSDRQWSGWVRVTALVVVVAFGLLVIGSYFR